MAGLFSRVPCRTAILLTHQSITTASEMYLRRGWQVLLRDVPGGGGELYQALGKELRPTP
jgi:hypothetical protein